MESTLPPDENPDTAPDTDVPESLPVSEDHPAVNAAGELHPYYCPGCGRGYPYPAECSGTATAPHPPVQTVSTDELHGDEHTAAPDSNAGV